MFYVSEKKGLVREVWDEKNGDVYWRSYDLISCEVTGAGALLGHVAVPSFGLRFPAEVVVVWLKESCSG